ncbi:MAG TPA: hypothetical protein VG448_11160 [Solirubrobacterales bacterium]|jgi:hypothetical protein|nr:hypothetical protein [Solirubrobacterales bacterium]
MAESERQLLEAIDAKLGGILALLVDLYLRETGVAKPRPRGIDKQLADVGLSPAQIAAILGKTERAVRMQLADGKAKKKS